MFAAARANLVEVLPKSEIELAIVIAKGNADFLRHDLVDAVKGVQDPALQAEFKTVNDRAAAEMNAYADWLAIKERLPKADPKGYALGEEKYRKMLAYSEALDLPPAKLLEIGLAELKREQGEFAAAAKIIDPSKPPIEVFKAIQHDHPTSESLLPDIRKHLEMIRGFMVGHNIIDIPSEVRANVEETPKYLRAGSFASSDNPGPFEVIGAQAYYYVTPTEPEWSDKEKDEWLTSFNYYTADIVSIHEVYPGHYVQALRMNASPATKVQRIFSSYAYVEGWAHYCEQMAVEEGFGRKNAIRSERSPGREVPSRAVRRGAAAHLPAVRVDQAAHAGHERGGSDEVLRGQLLLRAEARAPGSAARDVRSRVPVLHGRQAGTPQAAARLQGAGGGGVFVEEVQRRDHGPRLAAGAVPARVAA